MKKMSKQDVDEQEVVYGISKTGLFFLATGRLGVLLDKNRLNSFIEDLISMKNKMGVEWGGITWLPPEKIEGAAYIPDEMIEKIQIKKTSSTTPKKPNSQQS